VACHLLPAARGCCCCFSRCGRPSHLTSPSEQQPGLHPTLSCPPLRHHAHLHTAGGTRQRSWLRHCVTSRKS
jgi:hypothetical protein